MKKLMTGLLTLCLLAPLVSAKAVEKKPALQNTGKKTPLPNAVKKPSLQDTVNWLLRKINDYGGYFWEDVKFEKEIIVEESENKTVLIINESILSDFNNVRLEKYTVSLKSLDPGQVTVQKIASHRPIYRVVLVAAHTKSSETGITYEQTISDGNMTQTSQSPTGVVRLDFEDESIANRVAKAFVHAIHLTGGKPSQEPF